MSDEKRIQPSWWYSLLAIPCFFLGIGFFLVLLFHGTRQTMGTLTQVIVPGRAALNITKAGTYTIFLEQPSVVNGKIYSDARPVGDLTCRLTQQLPSQTPVDSPQTEVALRYPLLSLTYSDDHRSGRSVLEFEADQMALYHLSCGYPDARSEPQVVLAVGTGVGKQIFGTLLRSICGLLLGVALGAIDIIIIFSKREKVRRRLLDESVRVNQERPVSAQFQSPV